MTNARTGPAWMLDRSSNECKQQQRPSTNYYYYYYYYSKMAQDAIYANVVRSSLENKATKRVHTDKQGESKCERSSPES